MPVHPKPLFAAIFLLTVTVLLPGCKLLRSGTGGDDERANSGGFRSSAEGLVIPRVESLSSGDANGLYQPGDLISIDVQFTQPVTVIGTPKLQLDSGPTVGEANYVSGNESPTLRFAYLVRTGDTTPLLKYLGTRALILPPGSFIQGAGQTAANVELPVPGTPLSLSGSSQISLGLRRWVVDEDNAASGLNYDGAAQTSPPSFAVHNGELYVSWLEEFNFRSQLRVKKRTATGWISVDGNQATGLNFDVNQTATSFHLFSFGDYLYATWIEFINNSDFGLRIRRFDGNQWIFVDGNGPNGVNLDPGELAIGARLMEYSGNLYVMWGERVAGTVRPLVKKFNGNNWVIPSVNSPTDLVLGADFRSGQIYIKHNNVLHTVGLLSNNDGVAQVRVRRYDGAGVWTFVDGGVGLNVNPAQSAFLGSAASYKGRLLVAWMEGNPFVIHARAFDGQQWIPVNTNGINRDLTRSVRGPQFSVQGSHLFLSWGEERNGPTTDQIKVSRLAAQGWIETQGQGINRDPNASSVGSGSSIVLGPFLFKAWREDNRIRVSRY